VDQRLGLGEQIDRVLEAAFVEGLSPFGSQRASASALFVTLSERLARNA
jgi:hypothetical protein